MTTVAKIIHEVEKLTEDERAELVEILKQQDLEKRRAQLLLDIEEGRREFAEGKGRVIEDPKKFVQEILDETAS
ncbi:MAG: hypothetical protein RH917_19580 [Lacipirellulaceae bacterium]